MMNVRGIVDYNKCEECIRRANIKTAYGQEFCCECFATFVEEQEDGISKEGTDERFSY